MKKKIYNDYDVKEAFRQIELELIASMKRNLSRHQKWETDEGINWTMWQAEQLKTFDKFKRENKKIFGEKFNEINLQIEELLQSTYKKNGFKQEREILKAIRNNKNLKDLIGRGVEGSFFSLNTKKMNSLISATTKDMKTAETAMLRMTNDKYRKTIFDAQVFANSGAGTLNQAIDMATKDFLSAGINCIQYKDGRRVNIASYAEMAIRTANKRAVLISEGDTRKQWGIHTVKVSSYGQCSETCLPWQGRVYVDDVYSGGMKEEAKKLKLPLMSEAIAGGLFHPNCKHRANTYYPELDTDAPENKTEIISQPEIGPNQQDYNKNQLQIQKFKRIKAGSLTSDDVNAAQAELERLKEKEILLEEVTTTDTIANGKDLISSFVRNPQYELEIEDLINQQGFDGLPKLVYDENEFYRLIDDDHFIAERTFSNSESQKYIDAYYDELKKGDFYVKCSTGGFQYGRGMYCAADYTKGTIDLSKFQHEIDQYTWGNPYSKTVWITMDKSSKIINFNELQKEYALRWLEKNNPSVKNEIANYRILAKELDDFPRTWDIFSAPPEEFIALREKTRNLGEQIGISNGYTAANLRMKADGYDWGILAAEMGFDAINSSGHGATGSYTVVLNRTKLIIFDGENFNYRRR